MVNRASDFRDFYQTLSLDNLDRIDHLYAADAHYHDPFMDLKGRDGIKEMFRRRLIEVDEPRYQFTHIAADGDTCFLRWHYTCRPKFIRRGLPWICDGVTEVIFDDHGLVKTQLQHWDVGEQVYEKLPILRAVIRMVKRRVRSWNP